MTLFSRLTDKSAQLATTDYLLADVGTPPVTGRVTVAAVNALAGGGGGGSTEFYSARLNMNAASINMLNGSNAFWTASDIHSSTEVEWDDYNSQFLFSTAGVYEVVLVTSISVLNGDNFLATASKFGVILSGSKFPTSNSHYVTIPSANTNNYDSTTWTSVFQVSATVGKVCDMIVSADCYNGGARDISISVRAGIRKVGSGSFVP